MANTTPGGGGGEEEDPKIEDPTNPGGIGWSSIAPGFLTEGSVLETLRRFGRNPIAFVLGAVLQALLGGVEAIVTALLDAIRFLFVGSDPTGTDGQLGIADVPLLAAELVTGAGDTVGSAILASTGMYVDAVTETALAFGPLSPVAVAAAIAVTLYVGYHIGMAVIRVVADVIPGLGGLV